MGRLGQQRIKKQAAVEIESTAAPLQGEKDSKIKLMKKSSKLPEIEEKSDEIDDFEDDDTEVLRTRIIMGIAIVVGIIALVLFVRFITKKDPPPEIIPETTTEEITISAEEQFQRELKSQGLGLDTEGNMVEQTPLTSIANIRDFFGKVVSENYTVNKVTVITDGVSYKKYRSITDEGVELYYLIGEYKGKKCIVTIPYSHFSTLSDEGVVICEIEILKLEGDGYIVSYFRPIKDPKIELKK